MLQVVENGMLKCLELIGFKSFAEKTRFDFGAGVTAIVGPNGSGKSNIIDSIRWILGEQSAKSLRGKEMSDVIFNGSGTRRSLGVAEVNLYIDNTRHFLPMDAEEIVLTRRVYRTGEGEYLINGQASRLRDIRDLFLGTGASAYSIIEQGKVDQMLQLSPKDRRAIFEEAAGISRFRARKIEALRRLDRSDQNILRAQDIHEELEKQLRSLRQQAGKARRYKETFDRLKELRLLVAHHEISRGQQMIADLQTQIVANREEAAKLEVEIEASRAKLTELETSLSAQEELSRETNRKLAEIQERYSVLEGLVASDSARQVELQNEIVEQKQLLDTSRLRAETLRRDVEQLRLTIEAETKQREATLEELAKRTGEETSIAVQVADIRARLEAERQQHSVLLSGLGKYENEQGALESHLGMLWHQRERLADRLKQTAHDMESSRHAEGNVVRQERAVRLQQLQTSSHVSGLHQRYKDLLKQRSELLTELAQSRDLRTALSSRIDVLENLRLRHEGLGGGVKHALTKKEKGEPVWQCLQGVLAECLEVPAQYADLVELTLGPRAQALVVSGRSDLTQELMDSAAQLPGRVYFLPMDDPPDGHIVVVADDVNTTLPTLASFVRCDPALQPVVDQILGDIFLAEDFESARKAAAAAPSLRFVTMTGEVLEPDGSISAGPIQATTGVIARSAEVRDLRVQLGISGENLAALEAKRSALDAEIHDAESHISKQEVLASTLAEQIRHFETVRGRIRQQIANQQTSANSDGAELQEAESESTRISAQLQTIEAELRRMHAQIGAVTQAIAADDATHLQIVQQAEVVSQAMRAAQLQSAKIEERLSALIQRQQQLSADQIHAEESLAVHEVRLSQAEQRLLELRARLAENTESIASLTSAKLIASQAAAADLAVLEEQRAQRKESAEKLEQARLRNTTVRQALHSQELKESENRFRCEAAVAQIREDYAMEIEEFQPTILASSEETIEEWRQEVAQLKDKIQRIGGVNQEAIVELEDLEKRSNALGTQLNDLLEAKRYLERVIERINQESRRLFLDTFEAVRVQFQEMFRKLFGGGKADIILEDEADVLECGIEIIARPPGKEPRSISLLSGGEKTLSAVALVMALFRSKPSPFCILDEVDAALDEANIGRFVGLIKEFSTESHFLVITHSKTTMAAADVLHGITQRESGVSMRVSVRVEDVAEDGRIAQAG